MANSGERFAGVACTVDKRIVDLAEGRSIFLPLAWYPRLLYGAPRERNNWEIAGAGFGNHWLELEEDLSVEPHLRGRRR